MTKAIEYVKELNRNQSEIHYTLTHLMGHAMGWGLWKMRRDVGRISWGFFRHQKRVGITCLVEVDGGKDLVPCTLFNVHEMSLEQFAQAINNKIKRAKAKQDDVHNQQTAILNFIPSFIAQPLMWVCSYISLAAGFNIAPLALRNDSFGHLILTNIGTLGLTRGYAPLCPPMHSMGLYCIGKIEKRPIVDDSGQIIVADMTSLVGTGDHRFGDAIIWNPLFKCFRGYVEDPVNFDPSDLVNYPENPHYSELVEHAKAQ